MFTFSYQLFLRNTLNRSITIQHLIDSINGNICAQLHQSFINIFHISIIRNRETLLHNDSSRINILIQEESRYPSFCFSIDYSPIDWSCTTIHRQQSSMHIKSSEPWHSPHHFW